MPSPWGPMSDISQAGKFLVEFLMPCWPLASSNPILARATGGTAISQSFGPHRRRDNSGT